MTLKKVAWNPERIATLSLDRVRDLRVNALRYGDADLAALCDADIARRSPSKKERPAGIDTNARRGRFVVGFHFVCERDNGVTKNADGTFWTGTWVVDQRHAERVLQINGYVALHASKAEPSYRQGLIKAWRKSGRETEYGGRSVKVQEGIDFLVEPTSDPYRWVGAGAGEKGYAWKGA